MDRALRAALSGELSNPTSPFKYIEWALRGAVDIPQALKAAVERRLGRIEDYESLRNTNEHLKKNVKALEAALLEARHNKTGTTPQMSDRPLRTQERENLRLMALAGAITAYGYRPGQRNEASKLISDQLDRWGPVRLR